MQQQFSSERRPTVWKILPAFEQFLDRWRAFGLDKSFAALHPAIEVGLKTFEKYYEKANKSSAQIIKLCKSLCRCIISIGCSYSLDLNPSSKEEYFAAFWTTEGQEHACKTMNDVVSL